jgi:hypothetical protein
MRRFGPRRNVGLDFTGGPEQSEDLSALETPSFSSFSSSYEALDRTGDRNERLAHLHDLQQSEECAKSVSFRVWKIIVQLVSYSVTNSDGRRPYDDGKDQSKRRLASAETDSHLSRKRICRLVQFTYI